MARKQTLDAIIQLYKKLGGNTSEVLGTKTNINFLGKGKTPEPILEMDINTEALGVMSQTKAIEELTNSVGYALSGKLNDLQANKLLENMSKMDRFYNPPAVSNITDLATRTGNLDAEGIMTLRRGGDPTKYKPGDPITSENFGATGFAPDNTALKKARELSEDLPPPGSRGGPEDIAAPFTGAGLEAIKSVKNNSLIVDDLVDKVYQMSGVAENAKPVARANARDFLNRVKDLEDPEFPGGTTLSGVMEPDDLKFATEGGGGGLGDPLLLVQKYFGPKVAGAVAKLDSPNDIQEFAENLVKIKDAKGNSVTSRYFDPESISFDDFEFAEGGKVPAADSQLVKESDEVLGYRGDAGYRSGSEQASSIGQGNVGTQSEFGDGPAQGGGGGNGSNNQTKFNLPVNVSIQPDYTPIGATPRYLDVAAAVKGGLLNLRTDLFDTIKDEELDSELSYTGALGPVNINAKTDFRGNKSLGLGFNKGNFSGGAFTDFDGNKNIGFNYSKTFAEGGRVPMFAGGAARIGYQALRKYGIEAKDISRLFANLGADKSLVGKEKTEYFRNLHKVLKNPDDFPDEILDIQKQLGIDIPGLKSGGLAGILEV